MATLTTLAKRFVATRLASGYGGTTAVPVEVTIPAAGAGGVGDDILLSHVPKGFFVVGFKFQLSGSLGAGVTIQPRVGARVLGAASTAGAASDLTNTIADLASLAAADRQFNVVIAGGAVSVSATLKGHVELAPR